MDAVFHWIHGRINFDRESNRCRSTSFDNVIAIASFSFRGAIASIINSLAKGAACCECRCAKYIPAVCRKVQRTLGGDGESRSVTFDPHQCVGRRRVVHPGILKREYEPRHSIRYKLILRAISGRFYHENVKSLIIYNLQTIRYDKGLSHKTKLSSCDDGKASF